MKFLRYVLPAVAVMACLAVANSASAQCYGNGIDNCWFGNLNAFGSSGTLYGSGYLPVPPYFAVHPPVYYSHPYHRPYGWSPFAQSGNIAPVSLRPEPRLVINPHVAAPDKIDIKPAADNTARAEVIVNPYFVQGQKTGQGRLASTDSR